MLSFAGRTANLLRRTKRKYTIIESVSGFPYDEGISHWTQAITIIIFITSRADWHTYPFCKLRSVEQRFLGCREKRTDITVNQSADDSDIPCKRFTASPRKEG